MEEYIRLEKEKAQRHGRTFNWQTAIYGKVKYCEDEDDCFTNFETEFPAIVFDDILMSDATLSCEPMMPLNLIKNSYVPTGIPFDPKRYYKDGVYTRTLWRPSISDRGRHTEGRKSGARLSWGHFIGRLAAHFGLVSDEGLRGLLVITCELLMIDLHDLVRLNICMSLEDTCTWGDQAVLAPVQAPQPPPPALARTIAQRLSMLEDEVHSLRGDMEEKAENHILAPLSERLVSLARNLFPPLNNPELTIRRRSHIDPTLLNDFEMATEGNGDPPVPDLRTMEELCQPSLNGRGGPIALIAIQATNFGLKNDMI
uniref:Reverse transcriptase domain-containing protein n=1 Tax=Tanacetum cinerariifolium TaxID=118510 RepID=A0A699H7S2_TANCI|nr:reverse transcriptase domain-containing protein [Tanacetum cinerariifolium]